MSDDGSVANGDGPAAWIVAAVIVVAIVVLLLFARGPEDQDRSVAPLPAVAALTMRG